MLLVKILKFLKCIVQIYNEKKSKVKLKLLAKLKKKII